ncbi:unnamed protein product [Phytophthora lilii]|uniref:Unnamed protein product n=1 Tax=Phytophthora lilii TaxID=2077276 RepID=A0A9W7CIB5_9STRA|nr:unnamed protein product [Phytophthora lilii]
MPAVATQLTWRKLRPTTSSQVTAMPPKRRRAAAPKPAKRARPKRKEKNTIEEAAPKFERLKDAHLPDEIVALPHVMGLIDTFAMSAEDAAAEACIKGHASGSRGFWADSTLTCPKLSWQRLNMATWTL